MCDREAIVKSSAKALSYVEYRTVYAASGVGFCPLKGYSRQALARYIPEMFERAQIRLLPMANRAAEHAPMVTACCNACRTCVQTNILALAFAGVAGAAAFLARPLRRLLRR
jgi:hypothetical protein